MARWIVTLKKRLKNALWAAGVAIGLVTLMGIVGAVAANRQPQLHRAKIASYAVDVEAGDPPGTGAKLKVAAKLAAEDPSCAEVTLAIYISPAHRRSGDENKPYFVQCMTKESQASGVGGYGVYFSNADLKVGNVKSGAPSLGKTRAVLLCKKAVLRHLRHPGSAHFSARTAYVSHTWTTNREVIVRFTALNSSGKRIHRLGKCYIRPDGRTDMIDLMNRRQ